MDDLRSDVINHLYTCEGTGSFIRPMYKLLEVKDTYGLSLNQFRKYLKGMEKAGDIYETICDFPCWKLSIF